jgi:isoquinoline 1-oxidoreductase beta subunit
MSAIKRISRREFLQQTGRAGGGLVLAVTLIGCDSPAKAIAGTFESPGVSPNVYVNLRKDGVVDIVCHRSEMGQGIRTCLPQIIADELDADWDRINLVQAIGDVKYGDQNTDGSTSIRKQFDLLRGAGASARELLVNAAAAKWQVPADECSTRAHAVHHEASGRSLGYGELVEAASGLPVPESPSFKSPEDYRYIGTSMDTIDGFAMTTGEAIYGIDATLPGMLYASIERCPSHGGRVKRFDASGAKAIPGVVDVIELPAPRSPTAFFPLGGVAVLANNTWSAQQGRAALKIDWDAGENGTYDSAEYRKELEATARKEGTVALNRGDVSGVKPARSHTAEYYAPHIAQAPMEPPAALARVDDSGCDVWSCTQNPQATQETVAAVLELDKSRVRAYVTLLGGGFGRKSKPDFAAEAAWLARETGKPVKVTWTREDDLTHGFFHAVSAQRVEAGMDEDGKVISWLHRTAFPSISSTFNPSATGPSASELSLGLLDIPYDIPNLRVESGDAKAHVRIGWLRSVCNVYHAFAVSSFADELAHVAGEDPRDFLARLIGPDRKVTPADDGAEYSNYGQGLDTHPIDTARIKAVLNKAADMAGWGRDLPKDHGLGIAVHRSFLSPVATVAHVSRTGKGKMRVHELWFAVDAGRTINPDRVSSQMEGAGIFGMSLAMHGALTAKDGAIQQDNFDTYPLVRIGEAPERINVHIMETEQAPPGGIGEPGVPPVAPALANAWFAATGERIREMPFRNAGIV